MLNRRLALALMGSSMLVAPGLAQTATDAVFAALTRRWLEVYLNNQPVTATQIGDHRFDSLIDDMSPQRRGVRVAAWKGFLDELGKLDRATLSRDNQVDAAILESQLRY